MCTLILLRRPAPGWRLVFLESRDHPGDPVIGEEMRSLGPVVGHYDLRSDGLVCGYNRDTGVVAGLANVPGPKGPRSRGEAMRTLLETARDAADGVESLAARLAGGEYSPAVYVVGDSSRSFRVENLQGRVEVSPEGERAFTTNHFRRIRFWIELENSLEREERVRRLLEEAEITPQSLRAAASETEGPGALCRLGGPEGFTLSSAMVAVPEEGPARFWFAPGPPGEVPYEEFLP